MASNINSLCKALGKPNQYKLLNNVPLWNLVPEERIGVVGTGGRTESEICNEIKYNIRKKAESSARRATGPLNDKSATANIGGKEVKVGSRELQTIIRSGKGKREKEKTGTGTGMGMGTGRTVVVIIITIFQSPPRPFSSTQLPRTVSPWEGS